MKAVQFSEYGGPKVLRTNEVDEPHAGPGQVRIAVRVAGVNPADWKRRVGFFKDMIPLEFPYTVGFEGAGVVNEIGEGVSGIAVGDAVFGLGAGTVAEHAVLKSWARKPEGMSFEEAAGLPVATETAVRSLEFAKAKAGETILISGAAGGVGSVAIQIARARGITVIGTASAPKHDYLRGLGALPTIYGPGLVERVRGLAPGGVDAALDLAGSGIIPELIEIVGDAARVVSISDFSAPKHGAQFTPTPLARPELALAEAARLHAEGKLRLHVDKRFPFTQVAEAQALSAEGHVTGKLIIQIV